MVNIKTKIDMKGHYDVAVIHADGTRDDYKNMENLIVNQGKDCLGGLFPSGYQSGLGGIVVGVGNATPAVTDIALQNPLAVSNNSTAFSETAPSLLAPYQTMASQTFTFAVGAVIGNIAEIGLTILKTAGIAATDAVFSRALIQVGGSPGTITVTATDQLVATYTITYTFTADISGSINVTTNGTPVAVSYTGRPMNLGITTASVSNPVSHYVGQLAASGWHVFSSTATSFSATNSQPAQHINSVSTSAAAYTGGSFTRTFTSTWNTGSPFSDRMYAVAFSGMVNMQILFASAIGPLTTQTMTFQFTYSW